MEETIPPLYQNVVAKAQRGEVSPRQAIKARCLQCSNFVRAEVAHCTVKSCALHAYRPYQQSAEE